MSVFQEPKLTSTPLPLPAHFSQAQQTFSLKKKRFPLTSSSTSSSSLSPPALLSYSLPPRPPSKGCPPLSRVFPQRPPSPWLPISRSLSQSPPSILYDPDKPQSYFSQCFTHLGLLGKGSFGEVYKVLSLQDRRLYAVKRSIQRFRGDGDRQRNLREARNHERLCPHPHILGFKAAWEEGGHLYIQTELCCTSLLMHAEAQPSSDESTAWTYLCDLLSALQQLHSQGYVHMDLKPANVFLTHSGRLKLGDFGLMLELKGDGGSVTDGKEIDTREEGQEGDPRYMAPELLRGEYSPAADVFSLGISILELACNMEVPKGGDGWQQLRKGSLPSEFTNALSSELQSVLRLMLAPDPSERATVPQLLGHPAVRRQKLKRQISLLLAESLLFIFSLFQSMLSSGWGLLSSLYFPALPVWKPSIPCTPQKESWEKNGDYSTPVPSFLHADTGSLGEELAFLPDELGLDHSPTLSQRVQSRLSVANTSTPLLNTSTPISYTPPHTLNHTHSHTYNCSITHTSPSTYSRRSKNAHSGTSIRSQVSTKIHTRTRASSPVDKTKHPSPTHSPVLNWVRTEPLPRPTFEPKNLLSLFDETAL